MNRRIIHWMALVVAVTLLCGSSVAQQELPDAQRAVIRFEIHLDQIRQSEFAETISLDEVVKGWMESEGIPANFFPEDVARITGAIGFPEKIDAIIDPPAPHEEFPFDFAFGMEFSSPEGVNNLFGTFLFQPEHKITVAGHEFYRIPIDGTPPNIVLQRNGPKSISYGTTRYLTQSQSVDSAELQDLWKNSGNAPMRMVADLHSRRDLIEQGLQVAKQEFPSQFSTIVDAFDNAVSAQLSVDPDDQAFIQLTAIGIDEDNASELRSVLDGLLGLAKMGASYDLRQLKEEAPDLGNAAEQVLNDLRATGEGKEIRIAVSKPKGLDKAIVNAVLATRRRAVEITKLNRFRQVILAMHNYHDAYKRWPPGHVDQDRFHESLSWRVRILPFMEAYSLYEEFEPSEPWDHDGNLELAEQMPEIFGSADTKTDIAFIASDKVPKDLSSVLDGTSNTIALIEYPEGLPWTRANDLSIDEAVELVQSMKEGERLAVGFYDGSVSYLKAGALDEDTLRALFDPRDGNDVDWGELQDALDR